MRNQYEDKSRTIEVESQNPQDAHKTAFFKLIKSDEEIVSMEDNSGNTVFDVNQGFRRK